MNRVIKFRIPFLNKDGSLAFFGYWGTIDHIGKPSLDHGCFTSPSSNGLTKGWHQQFTGLLDKNGKEIWEGDIVKLHDHPTSIEDCTTSVVFSHGSFVARHNGILLSDYGTAWTEVIGNIYETPELLSQ